MSRCAPSIFHWTGGGGGYDPEAVYNLILKIMSQKLCYRYNRNIFETAFMCIQIKLHVL